jgi:hypothetical protein
MAGGLTSCLLAGLDDVGVIGNDEANKEQRGHIQGGRSYIYTLQSRPMDRERGCVNKSASKGVVLYEK